MQHVDDRMCSIIIVLLYHPLCLCISQTLGISILAFWFGSGVPFKVNDFIRPAYQALLLLAKWCDSTGAEFMLAET